MSTSKRRGNREGSNPVQRKDGRWQVNLRYSDEYGVSRRTSVLGKTAQEARDKASEVRRRLDCGKPARDKRTSVGDFTNSWIDSTLAASERKAATKSLYATLARKHIALSKLGALPLDRLKASHIEAWLVELRRRGLAPSTIRSTYTVLRAVLDTAVRDGAIGSNPAALITRPRVTNHEAAYLTPPQVAQLLHAAQSSRYASLFAFLVNTGLRRGEALAMRWSDLDFDKGLVRVRGTLSRVDGELVVTEPKTVKSKRTVPLSDSAAAIARRVRATQREERLSAGSTWVQTGYVFTTETGHPCDPRNALRALKAAGQRIGMPGIGLHTLRHSAASVMLVNGVPLKVVSEVLGHSSVAVTGDIYGHVAPDVARDALAGLGAALADGVR